MKVTLAILSLTLIFLSTSVNAAKGEIDARKSMDPIVNISINGDAAGEIFNNLDVPHDIHPGSMVKTGKNISCSAHPNFGKTSYNCILSVDQHGEARPELVR
jgi:hypothetical protein